MTDEEVEKIIKSNMMLTMDFAGIRADFEEKLQRKPLSDEEMYALARQVGFDSELMKSNHDRGTPSLAELFARAIEAEHGIKENT